MLLQERLSGEQEPPKRQEDIRTEMPEKRNPRLNTSGNGP